MNLKKVLMLVGFAVLSQSTIGGAAPKLTWVQPAAHENRVYDRAEVSFAVEGEFENPFDADEIAVDLVVESPEGVLTRLPAFYYQAYQRQLVGGTEILSPQGEPVWKARFTAVQTGKHRYWLEATDWKGRARSEVLSFEAVESTNPGFLRVSPDRGTFVFDDGSPYFAVGINLSHPRTSAGTFEYDHYLEKMGNAGVNWTRLWMAPPWGPMAAALEWTDGQFPSQRGKLGLKRYNLEVAWRVDHFVEKAESLGIYTMLAFGDERELETELRNRAFWHTNPYSVANGGPVQEPTDFFTNEAARRLYKNRLRYIVARWGYSTNVIWEFWNEIDHPKVWGDSWVQKRQGLVDWHQEMGRYLKEIDPYHHLVSTSFVSMSREPLIWRLPEIDFLQVHTYGADEEMTQTVLSVPRMYVRRYPDKPVLLSEVGTDGTGFLEQGGAEEVAIHNGLWASIFSQAAGVPIWWWWEKIDANDLYHHYAILNQFLADAPAYQFAPLEVETTAGDDVLAVAATGQSCTAIWVQNRQHNWGNVSKGKTPTSVPGVRVKIPVSVPGLYEVSRFDTWSGSYVESTRIRVESSVGLEVGDLERDVAFRVLRLGD